jgi:molybdopterin/thiamine biosynthesis adenylyltransferase/proteasome lid subunit RPN8/RPN11
MTASVVIPQDVVEELQSIASLPNETAGVMLAGVAEAPNGDIRLLARCIRWVEEAAYSRRECNGLTIQSEGYVHALAEAENLGAACIWVHTHPGQGALPRPSKHDRFVDGEITDLFRLRSGSPYYGTLILSPHSPELAFTGYLQREGGVAVQIERLWQVGNRWRLVRAYDSSMPQLSPIFDRNVRAFGAAVQQTLGDLAIGIIGCGGTGSSVAEQLVRLGVRHLTLVDPDKLSESNLTRVYGSTASDVGRPKVQILKHHLMGIAPDLRCETVQSMVTLESAARCLIGCDVVFGCTDDNAGRLVLSRLATYVLTPVIDCGLLMSSDAGDQLTGIDGRVTILSPGQACLICRDRINLARAGAELLTPDERVRREDEGYAPALAQTEPAVVAFTTLVGATAVSELLERLIGYGPEPRPSEILLRCHEREISTNIAQPRIGHYCHPSSGKLGIGMTQPFLEQIWPTL